MNTIKDIRELDGNGYRVFASTVNSKGKMRVSIVKGEKSRNKNEGELVYQEEFYKFNSVSNEAIKRAYESVGRDYE